MRSFGEYFDDQRDRIVKAMQRNKNTQLNNEWRERYDERENAKKKHESFKKELEECNEKGIEISQECKAHFISQFE